MADREEIARVGFEFYEQMLSQDPVNSSHWHPTWEQEKDGPDGVYWRAVADAILDRFIRPLEGTIARLQREIAAGFKVEVVDVTGDAATLAELGAAKAENATLLNRMGVEEERAITVAREKDEEIGQLTSNLVDLSDECATLKRENARLTEERGSAKDELAALWLVNNPADKVAALCLRVTTSEQNHGKTSRLLAEVTREHVKSRHERDTATRQVEALRALMAAKDEALQYILSRKNLGSDPEKVCRDALLLTPTNLGDRAAARRGVVEEIHGKVLPVLEACRRLFRGQLLHGPGALEADCDFAIRTIERLWQERAGIRVCTCGVNPDLGDFDHQAGCPLVALDGGQG